MSKTVSLGLLMAVIILATLSASPVHAVGEGNEQLAPAEGQYIVVFKDSVANPGAAAKETAKKHDLTLKHIYQAALKGFSAEVPEGRLRALEKDPKVAYVEAEQLAQAFPQQLPTGIDRVDAEPTSPTIDPDDTASSAISEKLSIMSTSGASPDLDQAT